MKGWVGLVGWSIADGLPTSLVTCQLQVERRARKVRRSKTEVLPLYDATHQLSFPPTAFFFFSPILEVAQGIVFANRSFACYNVMHDHWLILYCWSLSSSSGIRGFCCRDCLLSNGPRSRHCGRCGQWAAIFCHFVNALLVSTARQPPSK